MSAGFEADLHPETNRPRIRMNFANGWSISIVLADEARRCRFHTASVAACPTGEWGKGKTEVHEIEAGADRVAALVQEVASRPAAGSVQ